MALGNNLPKVEKPKTGVPAKAAKAANSTTDIMTRELDEGIFDQLPPEAQIKIKELNLKNMVLNRSCLISMTDKKGYITYINDKFCEVAQYTREELLGQNHNMVRHPDMPKSVFKEVWSTIGRGEMFVGNIKNMCKDGSHYWVDAYIAPILGADGKPEAYIGVRYDITDLMEAKDDGEALKEAIDLGWASIEFEPDGTILSANDNFVSTLGYATADEIVGKHHRIFCEKDYVKSSEYENFWKQLGEGATQSGEFKRISKDGKDVWINATYTPVKDKNGKIVKVIKIAADISEVVQARQKAEHLQAAVDIGWASIEFEPDGTIISANNNFISTMGYNNETEIKGQHHRIFVESAYGSSAEYAKFWKELANGAIKNGEYSRMRKDGNEVWLQAAYVPVKDADGDVMKVIKIATDISNVKHPILAVNKIVREMAQGDLTQRFDTMAEGYVQEMGDALNEAMENLNSLLSTIDDGAQQVANAADAMMERSQGMKNNTNEVASAISQMSKGAQDQASRTDESSKLAEEMMKSAVDMEQKANIINKAAESGQKSSESGLKIIKNLVENMTGISSSASLTSESIAVLTERADEIARTLNVITDIASQTNLLALNAAIEAARAGDAGRGFAVVAEEIRKLAEDSRKSAVDIEKIIKDVQKDTQSAGKAIETMESSVKQGNSASVEAESIFQEIAKSSDDTFKYSLEIQEATSGQKQSIDTVVKNIEQIVVVAEETAAGTQEVASSSQELNAGMEEIAGSSNELAAVATELQAGVNQFKLKK